MIYDESNLIYCSNHKWSNYNILNMNKFWIFMQKNKNILLLSLVLIGMLFFTSSPLLQPAQATSPQLLWSNDTQISNFNNLTAADPSIVTDSNGNAHIVWMQKTSQLIGELFYSKLDKFGNVIINNRQLTNFSGIYGFPFSIAIDRFDNIHMAWIWDVTGTSLHGIRYVRIDSNGNIIVNDSILQNAPGTEIATDSQGNIIVVGAMGFNDVYYAKYDNQGNLLTPNTLVANTGSWETFNFKVAIDSSDIAYIMWGEELIQSSSSTLSRVKYSSISSNGSILVNGFQLDYGNNYSVNPSLAIDKNNNVVFSWDSLVNGSRNLYLSKRMSNGTFVIDKKQLGVISANWIVLTDPLGRISLLDANQNFIQLDSLGNIIIPLTHIALAQTSLIKASSDRQGNIHLVWNDGVYNSLEVKYRKSLNPATLFMQGVPRHGSKVKFKLQDIYNINGSYVFALSTGVSQGINLPDGRKIPLNNDWLFSASISSPQSVGLSRSTGVLDMNNQASVTLAVPNTPSLRGTTVYGSFITQDSAGKIITISDAINFTII